MLRHLFLIISCFTTFAIGQPTTLLEVRINTDQTEYIKGELFQIDVKITNNDVNLLELQSPQLHHKLIVRHLEDNYEFTVNSIRSADVFYRELLPERTYKFSVTPATYMTYTEEGLQRHLVPGYYWKVGTYQIEMVIWNRKNEQYESNVYEFVVKPVPEQYNSSFNILRHKSRSNLAPTYKDMMKIFLLEKTSIYQYEMFYLLSQYASNEFKIERVTDLTIDLRNALSNLIIEKPNKQYIIRYVRHIRHFVNESKDLQAVAANKAFLTELADSVKTLSAKEPQRYEKLVQVLSGEEEQVFKN